MAGEVEYKEKRARSYFAQRNYYYETHDINGKRTSNETQAEWKKRVLSEIKSVAGVKMFAMIFHDKDVLDDGTPKGLHVHILITFESAKTPSAAMKPLGTSSVQNTQPVRNKIHAARYLTHISEDAINKDKHRYDKSEVICYNCEYSKIVRATKKNKDGFDKAEIVAFVNHLATQVQTGEITPATADRAIINEYGEFAQTVYRDYRNAFNDPRKRYMVETYNHMLTHGRTLRTTYISGIGRIGKTRLAEAMAWLLSNDKADHSYHKSAANGDDLTFDPFGGYDGQNVSVFNELNPTVFNKRQFFDTFDPHTVAVANSRNHDKVWLAKFALLTYTSNLDSWIHDLLVYSKGATKRYDLQTSSQLKYNHNYQVDYEQAAGRFAYNIELVGDRVSHVATAKIYARNNQETAVDVYLGELSCNDVTNDTDVKNWAYKVLEIMSAGKPVALPNTKITAKQQMAMSKKMFGTD